MPSTSSAISASANAYQARGESLEEEDVRTVVDLLIEQIEFCDVIALNKVDLVDEKERLQLIAILNALNLEPKSRSLSLAESRWNGC